MAPIYCALLGYVLWMLGLLGFMFIMRFKAGRRGVRLTQFTAAGSEISPLMVRLSRAHANCYENLPILLAIVFVANAAGQIDLLNGLAYIFLGARMAQSAAHISSGTSHAIVVRAVCFTIQVLIQLYWVLALLI